MEDLFFIKNFSSIPEAELARQILRSNGIESMIQRGNSGAASEFSGSGGDAGLYVVKKNIGKAMEILEIKDMGNDSSENFVNIGSYRAEEADMIVQEFEKSGIPVKRFYPGSDMGVESTGNAIWTAYTLRVRNKDAEKARKICEKFNISPVRKIPLPDLLYNKTSSVLLGIALFGIILSLLARAFDLKIINPLILIVISLISYLLYYVILFYKVIRKTMKK